MKNIHHVHAEFSEMTDDGSGLGQGKDAILLT
jgi:hypothetical protein